MFRRGTRTPPNQAFRSFRSADALRWEPEPDAETGCAGCIAPCCSSVTLHELRPATFRDVDFLRYVLGFDRIEIAYVGDGAVEVCYRALCRHLDRATARCEIHGKDDQPFLCQQYDASTCTYRDDLLGPGSAEHVRVSADTIDALASLYRYDARGRIMEAPARAHVREAVAAVAAGADAASDVAWPPVRSRFPIGPAGPEGEPRSHGDLSGEPCAGCKAPCCHVLLFLLSRPQTRHDLSFYRYLTGFAGLEIAVTRRGYVLQCHTRCRHLTADRRCGLVGSDLRPVFCRTYDAWSCRYVPTFIEGDPEFRRLRRDEWPRVEACFGLEEDIVVYVPDFDEVMEVLA